MRTEIIFVMLISLATKSSTLDLKCVSESYVFKESLKLPSCVVKNSIPRFDIYEDVKISGSKSEIIGFSVVNNTMPYIPFNFGDIFPKLKALQIKNSSLEEILPENFNKLKDLEYLDLSMNRIKYLDGGLFEYNNKLVTINFRENEINAINPDFVKNPKNFEIDLEGNACISNVIQYNNWNHSKQLIISNCWSSVQKLEIYVINNSLIFQRMRRSIDSQNMKNSCYKNLKTIEDKNQHINRSISDLFKIISDSKLTNLNNDLLSMSSIINRTINIVFEIGKNISNLNNLKQVISNLGKTIENEMQKSFNEVKSKLLQESKIIQIVNQISNGNHEKLIKQLIFLETNINDTKSKVNNILNRISKNQTNVNSELLEFVENKIQNSLWNWNMMINIINTALLTLLITLVIIFQLCKSNTKSSQDPQYDKIKKAPSRANSTIKSQRDLSVHPLSFDTLRRDNSENIADQDYFGMTQYNAYNDTDHKSHNYNLGHSDTVYECTQWNESKLPNHLDSEINENVTVEDNCEGLYSEIPSQINEVVTEDKKDDSQIYAVITKK